ncbi:MAG TPA: HisS family protein, partial [Thermomicrobiales bacterium]|nr:HisS family protein [Thermomicrobiales bacterium]
MAGTIDQSSPLNGAARARPVERVRGTHDRLAGELAGAEHLRQTLTGNAARFGYQPVDTPVLEHTDLFLRKSGGDRIAQLYAFEHRGRGLALRPEFTAPAVRLFIEHMQGEPLPVRLSFSGPVFRYEKPQSGRSRQFTEFGCELIGASGPVADAEIIGLALDGLRLAGVAQPKLVLGHIGVVINFLGGLDIDRRAQDWLTWSMERLRKGDDSAHELPPHLQRLEASLDETPDLPDSEDEIDAEAIASILRQAGVEFQGGSREPEDIVRGLFAKRRRRYDAHVLREAAGFVSELTRLVGPPDDVLQPLRDLVAANGLDQTPLDELEKVIELLAATGFDRSDVWLDLGMGRGLHYYTGMLFEIYAGAVDGPQLCGGGRYDDLAQVLGARQPVAACGFSYGLERVLAAGAVCDLPDQHPAVLVLQGDDPAGALALADGFRAAGWQANVDLRERNQSATRRVAQRQ